MDIPPLTVARLFDALGGVRDSSVRLAWDKMATILDPLMKNRGKNIRPHLVLWAAEYGAAEPSQSWQDGLKRVCWAVELIHMASLMIDDIQDESMTRRGIPCAFRQFGIAHTVNTANWAYFAAAELVKDSHPNQSAIHQLFYEGHLGQALDLMPRDDDFYEHIKEWTRDDFTAFYRDITERKTSRLFQIGPDMTWQRLGRSLPGKISELFRDLGFYFQWLDDIKNFLPEYAGGKFGEDMASPLSNKVTLSYYSGLSDQERDEFRRQHRSHTLLQDLLAQDAFQSLIYESWQQVSFKIQELFADWRRESNGLGFRHIEAIEDTLQEILKPDHRLVPYKKSEAYAQFN